MLTAWKKEQLNHYPDALVLDGENYIQRKNIQQKGTNEEGMPVYECDMRFISVEQYEMLKAMQNIMAGVNEV